jgi:hypothetical protein
MVDIDRLERVLLQAAAEEHALTYGQILAFFGRRVTPIQVSALCRDLGLVCRRVEARGGPDLACLVVRKSDSLPGEGYFVAMRSERHYDGPPTGPQAHAFIRQRQELAYAFARAGHGSGE